MSTRLGITQLTSRVSNAARAIRHQTSGPLDK